MKLGELLVREGKLTPADVEETLKGQAIFGGRFGTNLVEMGLLDENELAACLARKTGVPYASAEQFQNLTPQVLQLLPEETVKKYRVIPLALNNRKLSIAMADPSNFAAIDEISFSTGYIVVPHIAPELRIVHALEKYFNVKRDLRYIPVSGGGRRVRAGQSGAAAGAAPAQPAAAPATTPKAAPLGEPEEIDIFELAPLDELETFADLEELDADAVTAAVADWKSPAPKEADWTLDGLLRGLTDAPDRHSIAELVVGYLGRELGKAALFLVKKEAITGWVAQAGTQQLPGFETLVLAHHEPSILGMVADSKSYYLGGFPLTPANSRMLAALGGAPSLNQFLAPLTMMGRVVAILYVDGGGKQLELRIPELQRLLGKVSLAFEILILKNKIMAS